MHSAECEADRPVKHTHTCTYRHCHCYSIENWNELNFEMSDTFYHRRSSNVTRSLLSLSHHVRSSILNAISSLEHYTQRRNEWISQITWLRFSSFRFQSLIFFGIIFHLHCWFLFTLHAISNTVSLLSFVCCRCHYYHCSITIVIIIVIIICMAAARRIKNTAAWMDIKCNNDDQITISRAIMTFVFRNTLLWVNFFSLLLSSYRKFQIQTISTIVSILLLFCLTQHNVFAYDTA